ncbi:MAG TPA: Grx4 family monothiol glutaredoxin [Salinisphaeraceae bacterium]|nr:Grx4 family monothiol glutaredoxin [Salinisphaeraceae bacterium]
MSKDAVAIIKQEVESNPIVFYMKGTPDFPQCGFSARGAQALKACGVDFKSVNVFDDQEVYRQGVKEYSNWPTIPQLYVAGELVGGSDIIIDLYQSGELKSMLEEAVQNHGAG